MRTRQSGVLTISVFLLSLIWLFLLLFTLFVPLNQTRTSIELTSHAKPIGEIVEGTAVTQTFKCNNQNINGFSVLLATYARENKGVLNISLASLSTAEDIQSWRIDVSTLRDNSFVDFMLHEPYACQEGEAFKISISSQDGSYGNAVTIWASDSDVYSDGESGYNDEKTTSDWCFKTYYNVSFLRKTEIFIMGLIGTLLPLIFLSSKYKERKWFVTLFQIHFFSVLLISIACFLYKDYLFGDIRLFIFNDIATDSFEQTIPNYYRIAQLLETYGRIPQWDFAQTWGMAKAVLLDPLNYWPCFFGTEHLFGLLGFAQVLKIILAGLFFYIFMRSAKFTYITSVIGSLCYAFCGHMIVRGTWAGYPGEVVIVASFLMVLEWLYQNKRRGLLLPLCVVWFSLSYGIYSLLLYFFVFFAYFLLRYFSERRFAFKEIAYLLIKYVLLYAIGLCLVAYILQPQIASLLSSARASTSLSRSISLAELFHLSDTKTLTTAYLRLLSNDIQGGGMGFFGANNYLEGPAFYSGLLMLLMLPFSLHKADKRKWICYGLAIIAMVAYCMFENVRLIANGKVKETFKLSSFWIIIVIIFLGSKGLDHILSKNPIKSVLLFIVAAIIILPAYLLVSTAKVNIDIPSFLIATAFLFIYPIILLLTGHFNRKHLVYILLPIVIAEICLTAYPSINNRSSVSYDTMNDEYFNDTYDSLQQRAQDNDGLPYRIDYASKHLCGSLIQNFYGTRGYVGGLSYSEGQNEFIAAMGHSMTQENGFTSYVYGFPSDNEVNTLLGVRYLVYDTSKWPACYAPYGYKALELPDSGNCVVYENEYALPLFFTYTQTMSRTEFDSLTAYERRKAMLSAMVIGSAANEITAEGWRSGHPYPLPDPLAVTIEETYGYAVITLPASAPNSSYYILQFNLTSRAKNGSSCNYDIFYSTRDTAATQPTLLHHARSYTGRESVEVAIPGDDIEQIYISYSASSGDENDLENIQVFAVTDDYFEAYRQDSLERKQDKVEMISFEQDHIVLSTDLPQARYLFCSIPFNSNWTAYVDGEPAAISQANIAFMALYLPQGSHTVELVYRQPWTGGIIAVSLVGAFGWLTFMLLNWKKKATHWI